MLSVYFHRHAMPQIVWLQLWEADLPAVHFAQPPDVFPGHRPRDLSSVSLTPARPKDRRVWCQRAVFYGDGLLYVLIHVLSDRGGQGNIAGLAAFDRNTTETPLRVQIADAERCDRFTPHTREAKNQKNCDVARPAAFAGGADQLVHQIGTRDLPRRLTPMRRPIELRDGIAAEDATLHHPSGQARE